MGEYVRLCEGTVETKGRLIKAAADIYSFINPDKPSFKSIFYYNEEHRKQFDETGSIRGITDVWTNRLVFDFDSKDNVEFARKDALELCNRLIRHGVERMDLQICFSGSKGFSVEIDTNRKFTPDEFKAINSALTEGLLTNDSKIANASRVFRLPQTKHQSGLYKFPLTLTQLQTLSVDEIRALAEDLTNIDVVAPDEFRWAIVELSEDIYRLKNYVPKNIPVQSEETLKALDMKDKPKWLTNCRYAMLNGHFSQGDRNFALLCLAATFKNQGMPLDVTYRALKGAAELQAKKHACERFSDSEIYNNIITQVYSESWKGGQFSCREPGNDLYLYCHSLGDKKCSHDHAEETKPKRFTDLTESFDDYVRNIDKNTIKTGIVSLDKALFLSTGMNLGVIGAPGCHAKDTEILMYDGSIKKVQDVLVGDLLMGPDSKPRTVLDLCRGREEMIRIKPYRGEEFVVNKSHVLHLQYPEKKGRTVFCDLNIKAKDFLEKTSFCVQRKYKLKTQGVSFSTTHTLPVDPYILGVWLGDGHSDGTSITSMDKEISDCWISYGQSLGLELNIWTKENSKACTYNLTMRRKGTNKLLKSLQSMGLIGNKHIPMSYLTASRDDRLKLLAGLLDTDGHLHNWVCYEFVQKNKILAAQVTYLARSLGFHASQRSSQKYCTHKGTRREGTYQRVYISGRCEEIPCLLPRKKAKKALRKVTSEYQGFTYEYLPEDDFYGFTLSGDHLYLTGDFIIHHNSGKSSLALNVLNNTSKAGIKSVFASLDMHRNRMYEKVLYKISGLGREDLYRVFKTNPKKKDELTHKLQEEFGNVFFYDRSSPTVADIKNYILDCQEQSGEKIKLVMLDYFERVTTDVADDTAASKKIAGELQDLVNDLGICLITLVQPNKMALGGDASNPIYSYTAIKGSSFLYQSFRAIVSLWRPFYNPKNFEHDHYMQMAILKADLGELAELNFRWDGKRGEIYEMEDQDHEELERLLKIKEQEKAASNGGF